MEKLVFISEGITVFSSLLIIAFQKAEHAALSLFLSLFLFHFSIRFHHFFAVYIAEHYATSAESLCPYEFFYLFFL